MKQVLTDDQITALLQPSEYSIGGHGIERHQSRREFARAIERAVLRSPEVQALINAAQEFNDLYGWLWDTTDGGGFLSPEGVKLYDAAHHKLRVALCSMTGKPLPIDLDETDVAIDAAMKEQGHA